MTRASRTTASVLSMAARGTLPTLVLMPVLVLLGACAAEAGAPARSGAASEADRTVLAETPLPPPPANTAVIRITVRPPPGTPLAGGTLHAMLHTGLAVQARHPLGRFSLYPVGEGGTFLLRLDAATRRTLSANPAAPRLVLSIEVVPATATQPAAVAGWQVMAEWLPEPGTR